MGNSAPFLALVGVSLASGSGLITKEDELECVCREVNAISFSKMFYRMKGCNLLMEGLYS